MKTWKWGYWDEHSGKFHPPGPGGIVEVLAEAEYGETYTHLQREQLTKLHAFGDQGDYGPLSISIAAMQFIADACNEKRARAAMSETETLSPGIDPRRLFS